MIDVLVFSKDRAAQLDLLLRSIQTYAHGLYSTMTILWEASDYNFANGYTKCERAHREVDFLHDIDFELDVCRWVYAHGPVVSFLVDDDVFYREPAEFWTSDLPVSLRGGDYDYPFSLDGNVYRREDVLCLLDGLTFSDPTELEAHGHNARARLPFTSVTPTLPPCLVGVPANRVSVSSGMPHLDVDPVLLNERYLAGGRLIAVHDGSDLPAHANLEYAFSSYHAVPA